jgi:hypothetical protein
MALTMAAGMIRTPSGTPITTQAKCPTKTIPETVFSTFLWLNSIPVSLSSLSLSKKTTTLTLPVRSTMMWENSQNSLSPWNKMLKAILVLTFIPTECILKVASLEPLAQ